MQMAVLLSYTSEVYTGLVLAQEVVEKLVVVAVLVCEEGDGLNREERANRKSNVESANSTRY